MLRRGELEGRLDPLFYSSDLFGFLKQSVFEAKTLGSLSLNLRSGFGAGANEQDLTGGGVIQIRPTNIDENGELKYDKNIYVKAEFLETHRKYLIYPNEVLFNNTNSQELVGKTAILEAEQQLFHSNHITRIKVDTQTIMPKYLWLILNLYQQKKVFFKICTNWNNQSGVGIKLLKNLRIPLPSLTVQGDIVRVIEQAHAAKRDKEAEAHALLESIDGYVLSELGITLPEERRERVFRVSFSRLRGGRFDSYFHQPLFNDFDASVRQGRYQMVTFRSLAKKITSGATPLAGGEAYTTQEAGGIAFIRSGDINQFNKLNFDDVLYLKPEIQATTLKSSQLKRGDLLIAIVGATIGSVAVYEDEHDANINQALALVRFGNNVLPEYAKLVLKTSLGVRILDRLKRPVARANINLDEIASIAIPLPPCNVQERIAAEAQARRERARELEREAAEALRAAKAEVERMILGEEPHTIS